MFIDLLQIGVYIDYSKFYFGIVCSNDNLSGINFDYQINLIVFVKGEQFLYGVMRVFVFVFSIMVNRFF